MGGTQTYTVELARRLAEACSDFAVLAPDAPLAHESDRQLNYDVFRVPCTTDSMWFRAAPRLLALARKRGFDATFHVQWTTAPAGLAARGLSGIRHVFVAAHGRELLVNKMRTRATRTLYNSIRRSVLGRSDKLFPVSNFTRGLLTEIGINGTPVAVVPNGVDTDRFLPVDATSIRRSLGVEDQAVLLTVCRLVERKGIDSVIRTLPQLRRIVPNVVYLICGEGPDRERLERISREVGVSDVVRFMGRIPDEALTEYYSACDVFTMPARSTPPDVEGFGLVFLEAAACGKPSVALDDGGVPDAIINGSTGLLVGAADDQALLSALAELLGEPHRARDMGIRARDRVMQKATWDVTTSRLLAAME